MYKKFLALPFRVLEFIIFLPVRAVRWLSQVLNKLKEKAERRKIRKRREAIEPKYEQFNVLETLSGDFVEWEKGVMSKSSIGIILGARGKGKTAIGVKILENVKAKKKKRLYAMGFNEDDLPVWIKSVADIKAIANNSFVLIDEGGVLFSSRKAMTSANQVLSELILVSRHKSLSILFISQNSANLDVNILRQADYLVLKPSSLLQKDFERKKIKQLYDEVDFKKYSGHKGLTYIYSEEFRGFIDNPLPSFWSKSISKSFK